MDPGCNAGNLPKQIWGRKDRGLKPDVTVTKYNFQVCPNELSGSLLTEQV